MSEPMAAADQIGAAVNPLLLPCLRWLMRLCHTAPDAGTRFGRWDDLVSAPLPEPKLVSSAAITHYGRSLALEAKGRHADAVSELSAFESDRARLPGTALWLNNRAAAVLAVAGEVLAARLHGSASASIPHWRRALALQDACLR